MRKNFLITQKLHTFASVIIVKLDVKMSLEWRVLF